MSLLNLFARKKPSTEEAPSSLMRAEPSHGPHSRSDGAQVSSRRGERTARRELLYTVVRDCMARAGVLSSSYKFKVLSLDGWGRQFLVMVDLAGPRDEPAQRLAEIEAMIGQAAKARHDIGVKAVYWRQNHHVAVGAQPPTPQDKAAPPQAPQAAAPQAAKQAKPAAAPTAAPAKQAREGDSFEPINEQELAAFRAALAKGQPAPAAKTDTETSYTLLTGFENTELHDDAAPRPRSLSSTQYGDAP